MNETEFELKFHVPEPQLRSLRDELGRHGARRMRLVARYFDTVDGLLARRRISLRLRKEGRRWVQTLKAEGDSVVHRLEHNVAVRVAAGSTPALDPARHEGSAVAQALREALAGGAEQPVLVERFSVEVSRLACRLRLPDGAVEAALDIGTIRAGDRALPIREVELEHKEGDVRALFALAEAWREHARLWLDTRSKAMRGAMLAGGSDHGPPVKARVPDLRGEPSGPALLRAVLRSVLDQVLGNASEVAAGNDGEEHVHQLRVGLRRLRTALRELGCLAHGVSPGWDEALSKTFSRLGALRDDKTVARAVKPLLERAGASIASWRPASEDANACTIVREGAFQATLLEIVAFAHAGDAGAADATRPVGHAEARAHIVRRLSKLHRQVVDAGTAFESLSSDEQHRARKRLKRLRYLAEFVQPLWDGKRARRYLKRLGPAQDALGAHNDVATAMDKFRGEAERDPQAWFSAGYLRGHMETTARAARAELQEIDRVQRFWKR